MEDLRDISDWEKLPEYVYTILDHERVKAFLHVEKYRGKVIVAYTYRKDDHPYVILHCRAKDLEKACGKMLKELEKVGWKYSG